MLKIGNIALNDFPVILAPMEDVTDQSFRLICKDFGADLLYTEFISSEGLIRDAFKSTRKLDFLEQERPLGIQIFGHLKESLVQAAQMAAAAKPDLIDINYGCPVRKVTNKGAGAAFLKDVPKMVDYTKAVVDAVDIPVTAKTRIGWDAQQVNILEVALRLQDVGIKALAIHGRTRSQLYGGQANWDAIAEVAQHPDIEIPIFGNGDLTTAEEVVEAKEKYGVDGVMIGRGAMGNPWIFAQAKQLLRGESITQPNIEDRIDVCKKHYQQSKIIKGDNRTLNEMRKHYSNYFKSIPNIKPYRLRLTTAKSEMEVMAILEEIRIKF